MYISAKDVMPHRIHSDITLPKKPQRYSILSGKFVYGHDVSLIQMSTEIMFTDTMSKEIRAHVITALVHMTLREHVPGE